MKLEDIKANVGVCPECNHFSSFMETKKKNIYIRNREEKGSLTSSSFTGLISANEN